VQDAVRRTPRHIGIVPLVVTNRGFSRVFGTSDREQDSVPDGLGLNGATSYVSAGKTDRSIASLEVT
jgi:hypothetical protein